VDTISADADARHAALSRIGLVAVFCLAARAVFADGGIVQFQKQAGPFLTTVFSAPVPLRVGIADLSVLVQKTADRTPVLNCDVLLQLSHQGERDIQVAATRAQASNKLLYAAHPVLQRAGKWHLTVEIKATSDTVRVAGDMLVAPQEPPLIAHWPYFAVLPLAIGLFALNQWLKGKRKIRPRFLNPK
jgi:hypothetical protein